MSVDRDCSPEAAAMVGVSALPEPCPTSPWGGPIGCLEVGYVDGEIVLNPNQAQKHASKLDLTVAASKEKVVMIEAGADQIPDDDVMYQAIVKAHEAIAAQVDFIHGIVAEIGREKMTYDHADFDQELFDKIVAATMDEPRPPWIPTTRTSGRSGGTPSSTIGTSSSWPTTPTWTSTWKRSPISSRRRSSRHGSSRATGGRAPENPRSVPWPPRWGSCPRVHGSALFTRGQTQVLSVATLNTLRLPEAGHHLGGRARSATCTTTTST